MTNHAAPPGADGASERAFPHSSDNPSAHLPETLPSRTSATSLLKLAGFEILSELGRASSGVVYKARHLKTQSIVAVKMLRDGALAGAEQFNRFYNEAQILAGLRHPNVVRILEVGEAQGRLYVVLEHADHGSLADYLLRHTVTTDEAVHWIETIARAVHFVHQRGIVHRDLKPGNVLLHSEPRQAAALADEQLQTRRLAANDDATVVLPPARPPEPAAITIESSSNALTPLVADFGVAKRDTSQDHTLTGAILGTPSYMSPEQANGKREEVGVSSDTYSLGAILYELLTGRPPFKGETVIETLDLVRTQEPVPARDVRPEIPPRLEAICLKCLKKRPQDRFRSAEDLADELLRFREGKPPLDASLLGPDHTRHVNRRDESLAQGEKAWGRGKSTEALLWFADTFATDSQCDTFGDVETVHRLRLARVLRAVPRLTQAWFSDSSITCFRTDALSLQIAVGHEDGALCFHLCTSSKSFPFLGRHKAGVNDVGFSADGRWIVSASDDRTARVWKSKSGAPASQPLKHPHWVTKAVFSPSGDLVATACLDGSLRIWNWRTGEPVAQPGKHGSMIWALTFGPCDSLLVSTGWDGTARIWDAANFHLRAVLHHGGWIRDAAFSRDGQWIATASDDETARLWTSDNGKPVSLPLQHGAPVQSVAFRANDRYLATWTADGKAHVWDVETGRSIARELPAALLAHGSMSLSGERNLEGGDDGVLRLWDQRPESETSRLRKAELGDEALSTELDKHESEDLLLSIGAWTSEDFCLLAELCTGKCVNASGQVQRADPARMRKSWRELRRKHPSAFGVSADVLPDWRRRAFDRCRELGLLEDCIAHLGVLLERDPREVSLWRQRGRCWGALGQWNEAADDFERAIAVDDHDPDNWLGRAQAHVKRRRWEQATEDLLKAKELLPSSARVRYHLARVRIQQQKLQLAVDNLSSAVEHDPKLKRAWVLRAELFAFLRQWHQSARDYLQAEILGEDRPWYLYQHALVCLRGGDPTEHRRLGQRLLELAEKADNTAIGIWAAWTCVLAPDVGGELRALEWARQAHREHGGADGELAPLTRTLLGAALTRADQHEEALQFLQEQPDDLTPWDWLFLAINCLKIGDRKTARRWLRLAQEWLKESDHGKHIGSPRVLGLPWHQKAELRLLREETEALLQATSRPGELATS